MVEHIRSNCERKVGMMPRPRIARPASAPGAQTPGRPRAPD